MKLLTFSPKKQYGSKSRRLRTRKGFSIVEVAIAMGVVTLLMTTFLGVFGPAQKNIQRALSTKDANRLKDTLTQEMSILRTGEAYTSSFEKAFKMIGGSHDRSKAVIMYQYKANPVDDNGDGILPPYLADNGVQGRDYIMQTAVRTLGSSDSIEQELEVVDGPVFVVRMTQLVKDPKSTATKLVLSAWDKAGVTDPDSPGTVMTNVVDYPKAVIAFRAEFFKLNVNKFNYVDKGNWDFTDQGDAVPLGNAVTEVNMAVRR